MPNRAIAHVHVLGSGAAAAAVVHCLVHHRVRTTLITGGSPSSVGPSLLLNRVAVALLDDLFQCGRMLLAEGHVLRGRLVSWGAAAPPATVDEPGLVIGAPALQWLLRKGLERLNAADLEIVDSPTAVSGPASWTVEARGRSAPPLSATIPAGSRVTLACSARLAEEGAETLATIESVEGAWLFLLPLGRRDAALQVTMPRRPAEPREALSGVIARSSLVSRLVAAIESETRVIESAPRASAAPARSGWLAVGDSAVAFDPICGDGTAHAVRSGLLAAAVIEAILRGDPEDDCLEHYRARLAFAYRTHLAAVKSFYQSGGNAGAWRNEIRSTDDALLRVASGPTESGYRLKFLRLVRGADQDRPDKAM